jgi:hypothetical protein
MAVTSTLQASTQPDGDRLWMVGCLRIAGLSLPYPLSERDMAADIKFARNFFQKFEIGSGFRMLFASGSSEYAQFWPYEAALESLGACVALADNHVFDAGRSEMFIRRLDVAGAFGIGEQVLIGMKQMGFDLAKVFSKVPLIFARDAAADELKALGLSPWKMVSLGPCYAYIAPDGTSFHNKDEWLLESIDQNILVSSRHARANSFVRLPTGVKGHVDMAGHLQLL